MRALIEAELAAREFMPEIRSIVGVSTYATPSVWTVRTDRGQTDLVLRGEEDIRRLTGSTLLISDSHGIHYLIRDLSALDKPSRKNTGSLSLIYSLVRASKKRHALGRAVSIPVVDLVQHGRHIVVFVIPVFMRDGRLRRHIPHHGMEDAA